MRWTNRWWKAGAAFALIAVLAACGPPAVDEVVPNGSPAQNGGWCAVFTDEEVAALVGDDQLERVRQSGELRPGRTPSKLCSVLWAEGDTLRSVASGGTLLAWDPYGGQEVFLRVFPVLGEDGHKLENGTTVELADGVYLRGGTVHAWTILESEGEAPEVAEFAMDIGDQLPGTLSAEELAEIGERMRNTTAGVVDWSDQSRPFRPEDLEPFLDAAQERGAIGPWRGHELGQ